MSDNPSVPAARLVGDDVVRAYRLVLKRDPESVEIVEQHLRNYSSVFDFFEMLLNSDEARSRPLSVMPSTYRSTVSAGDIFQRHAVAGLRPRQGFVTDFVGSVTDARYVAGLERLSGQVEGVPSPDNFHADECEWAACLRAVDLASGPRFTALELGAGWAPWLVSCALAAKRLPHIRSVFCCGVEADAEHFRFMQEHFAANRLRPEECEAVHAAVGARSGHAVFPDVPDAAADWGARPDFSTAAAEASPMVDYRGRAFAGGRRVSVVAIDDLLQRCGPKIDLLHIDIQGTEAELIAAADPGLLSTVSYMVVGTHSRAIEGELMERLAQSGWTLEFEKPCVLALHDRTLPVLVDGCQAWRRSDRVP